ncbi:MAG: 4-hydroxybenzoate transporter [Oceanospirillum sp.]|nr:4-hydroxybenzoate transporter [Oceanospirillum sp.]
MEKQRDLPEHISWLQYRVFIIAWLLNVLDGFDITSMAFTAQRIQSDLALSAAEVGIVFSTTLAGMMMGALFLAPLADKFGRRNVILYCVLVIGLSVLFTGFVDQYHFLLMLRFMAGLGVGSMLASITALTSEYTPPTYRALLIGIVTAAYPLGATLGGFVAVPIMAAYNWQGVFVAAGTATLTMLMALYIWVPESVQFLRTQRGQAALDKVNAIRALMKLSPLTDHDLQQGQNIDKKNSVLQLLGNEYRSRTLRLWTCFFFCFVTLYFLMSWIPKLVEMAGYDAATSIYAASAFNGGAVVGILILGQMATRKSLEMLVAGFLVAAGLAMCLFSLFVEQLPLFASLFVVGVTLQGGFVGLYSVSAKLYQTSLRATGVGWAIGLGRFGAIVGPFVGGLLIDAQATLTVNFIIFAIPAFLAGVVAFSLTKQQKRHSTKDM